MSYQVIRGDITCFRADAIVNAANSSLLGGGGVDGAIHRAAGPQLLAECRTLGGCRTGESRVTGAYRLPARYVIHTVGPVYRDGRHGEEAALISCYRSALALAEEKGCRSVAFPLISTGAYGYPWREALLTALRTISEYLSEHDPDLEVTLVLYGRHDPEESLRHMQAVLETSQRTGFGSCKAAREEDTRRMAPVPLRKEELHETAVRMDESFAEPVFLPQARMEPQSLEEMLEELDAGFSETLLRLIDASGMTDAECYKRANIDRKLFSKIRSDREYHPAKKTAAAFAVALKLDLPAAQDLLARAGYTLGRSSAFDIILSYHILRGNYDVHAINSDLIDHDQETLGNY